MASSSSRAGKEKDLWQKGDVVYKLYLRRAFCPLSVVRCEKAIEHRARSRGKDSRQEAADSKQKQLGTKAQSHYAALSLGH